MGLGVAGGQILAFPIDIDRRPYNTLALTCECVINVKKLNSLKRLVSTTVAMSHNQKTAKIKKKRLYYLSAHRHRVNVLTSNINFFFDFCCFSCAT